jgi:hypothetical protein
MSNTLRPKPGGLAGILAQAPAVSAAFGRWPGFVLMMTAMVVVLVLGTGAMLLASNGAVHLVVKHNERHGQTSAPSNGPFRISGF